MLDLITETYRHYDEAIWAYGISILFIGTFLVLWTKTWRDSKTCCKDGLNGDVMNCRISRRLYNFNRFGLISAVSSVYVLTAWEIYHLAAATPGIGLISG